MEQHFEDLQNILHKIQRQNDFREPTKKADQDEKLRNIKEVFGKAGLKL